MNIAVIPARGGSKRLPRKNIRLFQGKPMIAWAIDKAIKSKIFDNIIVSTDDEEIASISREFGADIPFIRPKKLADDYTPTVPVIAHAIESIIMGGHEPKYVCCIYPCVPFLKVIDLKESLNLAEQNNADFIYPVTEYAHPVQRAMRKKKDLSMEFINPDCELARTQDLEKTYHDTGQFYWGKTSSWLQNKKMHSDGIGFIIPNWRVVDIDNESDWKRAEIIFNALKNEFIND